MNESEALEIVSYKLGHKDGEKALSDPVLVGEIVEQAISDKQAGNSRNIDTRDYLVATKIVKEVRLQRLKIEGQAWLERNGQQAGVVTCDSGLQYRMIEPGTGDKCTLESEVVVDYKGELIDGSVFDSSYDRGEPATFAVRKVIEGWQEGLLLMSKGSRYQLFIPYELGYGDRGSGSLIPAYSVLIFDVELGAFS